MKVTKTQITLLFGVVFTLLLVIGIFLRTHNITPFKIYPDAYQSLLVAENIRNYHSILGYLGEQGMVFPPFFMWTRPGFPLLINMLHIFYSDSTAISQYLSFFAGLFALPLSFFLIKYIFKSLWYGLVGMGLLSLSFTHTVWGGFIMTETVGVLLLFLLLFILFIRIGKKPIWADPWDFFIGIVFAFAVLTRYEYILLAFPLGVFLFLISKQLVSRIINIASAFILVITIAASQLYPLSSLGSTLFLQHGELFGKLLIGSIIFIGILLGIWKMRVTYKKRVIAFLSKGIVVILWLMLGYISLQIWLGDSLSFLWSDLEALRAFVTHEVLIPLFFMIGISLFLWKKEYRILGWFVVLSILPLGYIYYLINPGMDRYMTHLLPFFLIPATYGAIWILSLTKKLIFWENRDRKLEGIGLGIFLLFLVVLQSLLTYDGIRNRRDRSWFETAYEEQSAIMAKPYISSKSLLLVSFPEPYYYFTNASTFSVSDTYPYVYIPDSMNKKDIIVMLDMGMYDLFPHFASFVEKNFSDKKTGEFWVGRYYHYAYRSLEEVKPVSVYTLSVSELKKSIQNNQKR